MARTSALPLPDAAVRHILRHVDDLRATFPPSRGNRPFLAAFLRLVFDATGNVYGAGVTRKLLQLYAPEYRPSTVTLHDEILAFRESLAENGPKLTEHRNQPDSSSPMPLASEKGTGQVSALVVGLDRVLTKLNTLPQQEEGGFYHDALIRTLESENQRLRVHNEQLQTLVETHKQEKQLLADQVIAITTERDTLSATVKDLAQQIGEMAENLKTNDERVAASHRFAMGRIENAAAEARMWQERARELEKTVEVYKKKVADEQAFSDSLRQALSKLRQGTDQRQQ